MMNWETLLSFGDSITFGARSYLGYPDYCGDLLRDQLNKSWHVINHSTNGFRTVDLIRSIDPVLNNYKASYPSLITVMIGTNDIKTRVDLENFKAAYKQLVIKLKLMSVGNNIILIKIPRFTKQVFYPYHFAMNDQITVFNQSIEEIAAISGLRVLEFNLEDQDFFDGVHLNERGSRAAAQQLSDFILKDKGFESSASMS